LRPGYAKAFHGRGIAYAQLGEFARAIQDFDEALRLKPDRAETFFVRGLAKREMGNESGAASDFAAARLLDPKIGH
jgi:tetratricopeptide (TPR) repeat protein